MKRKPYYNLAFLTITFLFAACDGNGSYESKTYFENRSGHKITVEPAGNKTQDGLRILAVNEIQLVYTGSGRGASNGHTYGDIAGDSVVVTFDDTLKVSHLYSTKKASSRSYAYEHPRNLLNRKNYSYMLLESSKKFTDNEYRYIFTIDDYQDALLLNK
jgi:hypothetical protein